MSITNLALTACYTQVSRFHCAMSAKARAWTNSSRERKEYEAKLAACGSTGNYQEYIRAAMRDGHRGLTSLQDAHDRIRVLFADPRHSYERNHCLLMGGNHASKKLLVLTLMSPIPWASVSTAFRMQNGRLVYMQDAATISAVGKFIAEFLPHVCAVLIFNEITLCFTVSASGTKAMNCKLVDAMDPSFRYVMQSKVLQFVRDIARRLQCNNTVLGTHSAFWRESAKGKSGLNPCEFGGVLRVGKVFSALSSPGTVLRVQTRLHPSRNTSLCRYDAACERFEGIRCLQLEGAMAIGQYPVALAKGVFKSRLPSNYKFRSLTLLSNWMPPKKGPGRLPTTGRPVLVAGVQY